MNRLIRPACHVVIVALAVGFAAKTAKAQDPVQADPDHYKVLYEDSNVRVLRYDDTPGHVVPKHTHKYPYRVYVVTDAARDFITLDNKNNCQKTGAHAKLSANDELVRPPTTHCEVNTGTTDTHLIIFEFKKSATATSSTRRPPGNSFRPAAR
jgi:hypothetical protein